MKYIAILGSTGSIGKNALSVVETHADEFKVVGLAANRDVDTLEQQIRRYRPGLVALNDATAAEKLRTRIRDINGTQVLTGSEGPPSRGYDAGSIPSLGRNGRECRFVADLSGD